MEFQRNVFHLIVGVIFVILLYLDLLFAEIFLITIFIAFFLSFLSLKIDIPIISWFLDRFDREEDRNKFPGKGSIFFLIGIFLSLILFPKNIALASILILSFGDSFSPLIGKFGNIKYFLNEKKNLEGIFVGIGFATLTACLFVSITAAFFGSLIAMLIEGIDLKINDNVLIPIIAGTVIYLL